MRLLSSKGQQSRQSIVYGGNTKWKTVWWFLTKCKILFPYNPEVMFPGIYSEEIKMVSTPRKSVHGCSQQFFHIVKEGSNQDVL